MQKDWIAQSDFSDNVLGRPLHVPKLRVGMTTEMPFKLNLQFC